MRKKRKRIREQAKADNANANANANVYENSKSIISKIEMIYRHTSINILS